MQHSLLVLGGNGPLCRPRLVSGLGKLCGSGGQQQGNQAKSGCRYLGRQSIPSDRLAEAGLFCLEAKWSGLVRRARGLAILDMRSGKISLIVTAWNQST